MKKNEDFMKKLLIVVFVFLWINKTIAQNGIINYISHTSKFKKDKLDNYLKELDNFFINYSDSNITIGFLSSLEKDDLTEALVLFDKRSNKYFLFDFIENSGRIDSLSKFQTIYVFDSDRRRIQDISIDIIDPKKCIISHKDFKKMNEKLYEYIFPKNIISLALYYSVLDFLEFIENPDKRYVISVAKNDNLFLGTSFIKKYLRW